MIFQQTEELWKELHSRLEKAELENLRLSKENEALALKARLTELGDNEVAHTEEMIRLADELAFARNALRDEQFEHDALKRLQKLTRAEVDIKQAEIDGLKNPKTFDARMQNLYAQLGAASERERDLEQKLRAKAIHLEALSRVRLTDADLKRLEEREAKLLQREERMSKRLEADLIKAEADQAASMIVARTKAARAQEIEDKVQAELDEVEGNYYKRLAATIKEPHK